MLAGYTENSHSSKPFPRDGANDEFHMNMIRGLCLGEKDAFLWFSPDPGWNMDYMRRGGANWLAYAPVYGSHLSVPSAPPVSMSTFNTNNPFKQQPPYTPLYPSLSKTDDMDDIMRSYNSQQRPQAAAQTRTTAAALLAAQVEISVEAQFPPGEAQAIQAKVSPSPVVSCGGCFISSCIATK